MISVQRYSEITLGRHVGPSFLFDVEGLTFSHPQSSLYASLQPLYRRVAIFIPVSQVLNFQSDTWYQGYSRDASTRALSLPIGTFFKFFTACFVVEQSLVCSNTLGLHGIVQGDHVEDILTLLLWPAMSLNKMTKLSWSFNKKLLWSDISLTEHICLNPCLPRNCAMVIWGWCWGPPHIKQFSRNAYCHSDSDILLQLSLCGRTVLICQNCSYSSELFMFARTVHICQNCSHSPG